MDDLINTYNSNPQWTDKDVFNYLKKQYLPRGTEYEDVKNECKNILAGLKSKKELLENKTWRLTPETMKENLKDQKEDLEKRSHLSDSEISRLNCIDVVMEDPKCLQELIDKQNESMEFSIRY